MFPYVPPDTCYLSCAYGYSKILLHYCFVRPPVLKDSIFMCLREGSTFQYNWISLSSETTVLKDHIKRPYSEHVFCCRSVLAYYYIATREPSKDAHRACSEFGGNLMAQGTEVGVLPSFPKFYFKGACPAMFIGVGGLRFQSPIKPNKDFFVGRLHRNMLNADVKIYSLTVCYLSFSFISITSRFRDH